MDWDGYFERADRTAKLLSADMAIRYYVCSTEELAFPAPSFDVIFVCQCFWYFNHRQIMSKLYRMLKPGRRILLLHMTWLPFEDAIAEASERLVLKYSPNWSGAGETVHPIEIPACYRGKFDLVYHEEYPLKLEFTRDSWNGRMKACRGVGASLSDEEVAQWEREHRELLAEIAPAKFKISHYGAIAELSKK